MNRRSASGDRILLRCAYDSVGLIACAVHRTRTQNVGPSLCDSDGRGERGLKWIVRVQVKEEGGGDDGVGQPVYIHVDLPSASR